MLTFFAVSSLLGPRARTSRDRLARSIEAHGMTWFIEASECIDQEKFVSGISVFVTHTAVVPAQADIL
jgi:hypothetical protein